MKKTILIIVIYLLGYVCSYQYWKFNVQEDLGKWTKGDRSVALVVSIGSWCIVPAMIIVHGIRSADNDESAEW